jgi:7,8-dihydroneopterin aldolase/epimerase/oxygenase
MAEAAGDGGGGDKLILRGLQFHGFHGVKREERTLGQKFVVDVDAWMDLAAAGESDSIAHTVSYIDIYRLVSDSKICSEFFTIHFFCYAWSKWTW